MKNAIILSLAIITIVGFFLPVCAGAANDYDSDFAFVFGDSIWLYKSKDMRSGLTDAQINNRALFRSMREKKRVADGLVAQGFTREQVMNYVFPGMKKLIGSMRGKTDKKPTDASYSASLKGISYSADKKGREIDVEKLYERAFAGGGKIEVPVKDVAPGLTLAKLKAKTALRATFSTSFYSSGEGRSHNIKKALSRFNGFVVKKGEKVSFNKIVGPRTKENGFKDAKIIVNGRYVEGVGGGVCQVSTTLYNALLLSDMTVLNRSRHSLVSGYVKSGFDAMVSSSTDLVFQNNTGEDVIIVAGFADKTAVVSVYGLANPYTIKRVSVETKRTPPETQVVVDTEKKYADRVLYEDESFVLTNGSDTVEAEAYLIYYRGETQAAKKHLHTDRYSSAPRVVVKGAQKRPLPEEGGAGE